MPVRTCRLVGEAADHLSIKTIYTIQLNAFTNGGDVLWFDFIALHFTPFLCLTLFNSNGNIKLKLMEWHSWRKICNDDDNDQFTSILFSMNARDETEKWNDFLSKCASTWSIERLLIGAIESYSRSKMADESSLPHTHTHSHTRSWQLNTPFHKPLRAEVVQNQMIDREMLKRWKKYIFNWPRLEWRNNDVIFPMQIDDLNWRVFLFMHLNQSPI